MTGQKRTNGAGCHRARRTAAAVPHRPTVPAAVPVRAGRRTVRPVLLALCLAAGGSLAACGGSSPAVTTLRDAAGVTVLAADGSTHPGVAGEVLHAGDTVRTAGQRAELDTGGRTALLAPGSSLGLVGADALRLDAGTVVVDHRHGPGASVAAGPVTVDDIGRTAVRVERGFAVRVAVYDGGSARSTAAQRSVTVAALHELAVPGTSLPAAAAPLALRDDALDALAAPDLVATDVALVQRAAGLDAPTAPDALAGTVAAVRTAVLTGLPAAGSAVADSSQPLSERVLPVAIARSDPAAPADRAYAAVASLRSAGGSWGVVAALVGSPLAAVQQQITALLDTPVDAAALTAAGPTATPALSGLAVLLANSGGGAPAPVSSTGASTPVPVRRTTAAPAPTPTPSPTPLLTALVDAVGGLLGGGAPSPSPTTPGPAPTTSSPGLVGGLLGGLLGGG